MSNLFERILLLKQAPIFSKVATEDLRVVAQELEEEACFVGERVFDINDPSDRMYIIEYGKIGISLDNNPGKRKFIAELCAKECFGEMGMFDDKPRSATAFVMEDSGLLSLEKSKLRALIINYPELSLGIMGSISSRLRETNLRSK